MNKLEVQNPSKRQIEQSKNRLLQSILSYPVGVKDIEKALTITYEEIALIAQKHNIKYSKEIFDSIREHLKRRLPQLPPLPITLNNYIKIKKTIQQIREFVKGKGLDCWIDYNLYSYKFSISYSEGELESLIKERVLNVLNFLKYSASSPLKGLKGFECNFINSCSSPIEGIELIYSSYEGWLGMRPMGKGWEDSLLEIYFENMDDYLFGEKANLPFDENLFIQVLLITWGVMTNYKKCGGLRNKGI